MVYKAMPKQKYSMVIMEVKFTAGLIINLKLEKA
jgi:hypothetical protein